MYRSIHCTRAYTHTHMHHTHTTHMTHTHTCTTHICTTHTYITHTHTPHIHHTHMTHIHTHPAHNAMHTHTNPTHLWRVPNYGDLWGHTRYNMSECIAVTHMHYTYALAHTYS